MWTDRLKETQPANADEIIVFANRWIEDNAEFWIVDAIEYWDEHNLKTLYNDVYDGESSTFEYVDDDEAKAILEAYDKANFDYEAWYSSYTEEGEFIALNYKTLEGARQNNVNFVRYFNAGARCNWFCAEIVDDAEFGNVVWTFTPDEDD